MKFKLLILLTVLLFIAGCGAPQSTTPTSKQTAKVVLTLVKKPTSRGIGFRSTKGRSNNDVINMLKGYRIRINTTSGGVYGFTKTADAYFAPGEPTATVSFDVPAPATYKIYSLAIGSEINGNPSERTLLGYGTSNISVIANTTNTSDISMYPYTYSYDTLSSVATGVDVNLSVSISNDNAESLDKLYEVQIFHSMILPTRDCTAPNPLTNIGINYLNATTCRFTAVIPGQSSTGTLYLQTQWKTSSSWDNNGVKLSLVVPCIADGESLHTVAIGNTSLAINPTWN